MATTFWATMPWAMRPFQLNVTSDGAAPQVETMTAAIEVPSAVALEAAPMASVGATPPAQVGKAVKITSRWPQQPVLGAEVHGLFEGAAAGPPPAASVI